MGVLGLPFQWRGSYRRCKQGAERFQQKRAEIVFLTDTVLRKGMAENVLRHPRENCGEESRRKEVTKTTGISKAERTRTFSMEKSVDIKKRQPVLRPRSAVKI